MRWPAFFVWARLVLAFAALLAAGVSTQRFTLILRPVVLEIVIRALSTYLPRTVLTATPFIVVGTGIYRGRRYFECCGVVHSLGLFNTFLHFLSGVLPCSPFPCLHV